MPWKSKGLSDESIKPRSSSNKMLNSSVNYVGTKAKAKFHGDCLKQEKLSFYHGKIVNIYMVYELDRYVNISSYLTLENFLFLAVKLTKHVDIDLYSGYSEYSRYGIGFDRKGYFSIDAEIGRNVVFFRVDMSSYSDIDKMKKYILILGKGPTQELEYTLSAEKLYSINFTKPNTRLCLSLYYNGTNSYLFVNGTEIITLKAKDYKIKAYPLCLGNIAEDWSVDNLKETGLNVYYISVDYDAISVADILDIHKYLMKKNGIV